MRAVHYHLSRYISHKVAGMDYVAALRRVGVEPVDSPEAADVLILHDDPLALPGLIRRHRGRKRLIAYCVWETDILPEPYRESLEGVDRIWTCTPYAARAFLEAGFKRVDVVPHVVDPAEPTEADVRSVKERMGWRDDIFYFYTVVDSVNPRKNLKALLRAFTATFSKPGPVRLVVKQYRHPWDLGSLPNVAGIHEDLSPGEMAALHRVCHCCASAHHAEAWGLSLSEAMGAGNPVIATGYSGNMFYMNADNSFPVKYELAGVSREMCGLVPLFTPGMTWADIDERHLAHLMRKVAAGRVPPDLKENAARDMKKFSKPEIGGLMKELLAGLDG